MGVHGPAPRRPEYTIWLTDHNLVPIYDQIDRWDSIRATLRFAEVSSGEITMPADPEIMAAARTPMSRCVLERDGGILLAGPIEGTPYVKKPGQRGAFTIRWADDLALIAGRLAYPSPALAATAQDVAKWTATGNSEVLLRTLVDLNAGPGALPSRRVSRLVLGAAAGVGGTVTWSTRFGYLCDELRGVANAGGRLGFRTQQVGDQIEFQVYAPQDRTGSLWFAESMNNIIEIRHEPEAPKSTVAICGGKDAGVNRVMREIEQLEGWWRLETFVDAAGADNVDELDRAGVEELAGQAEVQRLAVVALDIPGQQYGVDYGLGDIGSVEPYPGGPDVPDIISAVEFSVEADKPETMRAVIGANSAALLNPSRSVQQDILRALARRGWAVEVPL